MECDPLPWTGNGLILKPLLALPRRASERL
jgi:hypothetical protein